jgi:hypothetical protein
MKEKPCEDCGNMFKCKSLKKKRCVSCDKLFRTTRGRIASIKHYKLHKEDIKEKRNTYVKNNKEHCKQVWREYAERIKNDPQKIVARRCRDRVRVALKAVQLLKTSSNQDLCGCTWAELTIHIEKQFTSHMSWSNYGDWHIDHIRPCASFDLTNDAQVRQCFCYTNLQPLWAKENLAKGSQWQGSRYKNNNF